MGAAREALPSSARSSRPDTAYCSRAGDAAEREADRLAYGALRTVGEGPVGAGSAVPTGPAAGRGLTDSERSGFERAFGFDFSRVRLFAADDAGRAARGAGALALTLGDRIAWGASVPPESAAGRRLLAHELAHIAAGHTSRAPYTIFRQETPGARLPDVQQRRGILDILDPRSASNTPRVTQPDEFVSEYVAIGNDVREASMPGAEKVRDAPVSLAETDLTDVTVIAEEQVRAVAGSALSRGAGLAAARGRFRYIPRDPGAPPGAGEATLTEDELSSLDVSAARILMAQSDEANKRLKKYNVLPGDRDRELHNRALRAIVAAAPAVWRTIALTFRGWNTRSATMVQRRIVPSEGETAAQSRGRGRWLNLGTSIHELLHAVTHPTFTAAIRRLERADLGVEGFTEFFTRRAYGDLVSRAAGDDALRQRIEGAPGPPRTPPPRTSYTSFFLSVTDIFHLLEDNIDNMRQAYFAGRVEFLGLGRWNELSRGLPAERGHLIGAALLLESVSGSLETDRALVRASYGRLIWGRSGAFQLDLRAGGGITYLSEGQRLGIGPEASLTLRGPNLFLSGGVLAQGSVAVSGPTTPGIESLLRLDAGAQLGTFHIGPTVQLLVPVTDRDAAGRGVKVFAGLGASFVFGR